MLLPRRSFALTSARRFRSRSFPPVPPRAQLWPRQLGRRAYATAGHAAKKAGSDLPWLFTSIAITVPTCFYLLQPKSHDEHHHEDLGHGNEHAKKTHEEGTSVEEEQEEHEEHKDDEAKEQHDDTQGATESSDQSTEESSRSGENREQSSEESESPEQPDNPMGRPKEKTDISESQDDGVLSRLMHDGSGETDPKVKEDRVHASDLPLGKGPRRDSPPGDRREHIDDSKGTGKKRIESEYGHRQGPDQPGASEGTGFVKDEASTSKPAGGQHTMSGKQEGVSNTDTKFSVDLMADHPTPHKGEGVPESAKNKGTVDPYRPQPEQWNRDDTKNQD